MINSGGRIEPQKAVAGHKKMTDKIDSLISHSTLNWNLAPCRRSRVFLLPNGL